MKKMNAWLRSLIFVLSLLAAQKGFSQNVGINSTGNAPDASAGLDISFTNKGLLIPRVALTGTADVTTISSPTTSLMVYNTATAGSSPNNVTPGYYYWTGSAWLRITTGNTSGTGWGITGNSGTTGTTNFLGTTDARELVVKTNNAERLRVSSSGDVGIGVTDPANNLVVKDTLEIRRTGSSLANLVFSNTSGWGNFRMAGDGGDLFWQGGGGNNLQIGSYWTTTLMGDRQSSAFPSFVSGTSNVGVMIPSQRDLSVPLVIQGNSATQSANLTEWRNSSGTSLASLTKSGHFGIGTSNPVNPLVINSGSNPLALHGVQTGTTSDSILTVSSGVVKRMAPSSIVTSSSNAWALVGNTGTASTKLGTTGAFALPFITNNIERMRISSAGKVGINVTSPAEQLEVGGNAVLTGTLTVGDSDLEENDVLTAVADIDGYAQIGIQNLSSGNSASSDVVATSDNGTQYINMGINSSSYTTGASNILNGISTAYLYANAADFYIGNGAQSKSLIFFTNSGTTGVNTANGTEKMRIKSDGTVGIGTTNPNSLYKLDVSGVVRATGNFTTSDRRLKAKVQNLQYGLQTIKSLNPVSYYWKDKSQSSQKQIGLIAQDARKVIPEIVTGDEKKEHLAVNYTELIPVLINAIKEQQTQIEDLKKKVTQLEKK